MWPTFVIFKNLPIVNNGKLGENSPNPVTLSGIVSACHRGAGLFMGREIISRHGIWR
jgi:hypothetical protein